MAVEAAGLAAKKGYTNIKVFKDGIPAWVQAGYPLNAEKAMPKASIPTMNAQQLKEELGKVQVLDIRPPLLHKMGWIKGSLKIPLAQLSKRYDEIPKGKKVVVVDHAGVQCLTAARFLKSKGLEAVRLQGGILAWTEQGNPLDK
jgi:rhodanese-related sulfurtransferase